MNNRIVLIVVVAIALYACKTKNKKIENDQTETSEVKEDVVENHTSTFENKLLDIRDVKLSFNETMEVEKFGMIKFQDSIFGFVFRLNDKVSEGDIQSYSFGVRGFSSELSEPFFQSWSPDISIMDGNKYLILRNRIENVRYFDSIDVFNYERQNWNKSGRLGGFIIKDILFE